MKTSDMVFFGACALAGVIWVLGKVGEYFEDKEREQKARWDNDHPNIDELKTKAKSYDWSANDAQYKLGIAYYNGRNVPQDYSEAYKWLCMAADQGNSDAVAVLGAMLFAGHGIPKDLVLAHVYFNMAAARGHSAAGPSRDAVTPLLTASQLETAQKLASKWSSTWPVGRPDA